MYDEVLKALNTHRSMKAIAYADDLALLFSAPDAGQFEATLTRAMGALDRWFNRTGLRIAVVKTEAILLTGRRVQKIVDFQILGSKVTSSAEVGYLGVVLDNRQSFRPHLEKVTLRAEKVVGALSSLLPNTRGPSQHSRRLYYVVWESIVMYVAPVWATSLDRETNAKIIRRAQRSALIKTTTAYRTVSFQALCVLAGKMPLKIKAMMAKEIFTARAADGEYPTLASDGRALKEREAAHRKAALAKAMRQWQEEWDKSGPNSWTRRIVGSVETFSTKGRPRYTMDYFTTQILMGHGVFGALKKRIGKIVEDTCQFCGSGTTDDAEHVLTRCPEYEEERAELATALGGGGGD